MKQYVVVGGGLAGLTAANALAGEGRKITLLEQSERLGGRAITQQDRGYLLNLGPHALHRGGVAAQDAAAMGRTHFTAIRPTPVPRPSWCATAGCTRWFTLPAGS